MSWVGFVMLVICAFPLLVLLSIHPRVTKSVGRPRAVVVGVGCNIVNSTLSLDSKRQMISSVSYFGFW
jgi:hypothetical protein